MRAILMVLALTVSTNAPASEELCDAYADVMYTISEQRDSGVSRREMRARVIREVSEDQREVFLTMVDLAFERPHYAPEEEANNLYVECMQRLGATRTELSF